MKTALVLGAGGFIGGHLVGRLIKDGNSIVAADIKPKEYWFQDFSVAENHYDMDMKDISNCRKITKNFKVKWDFHNLSYNRRRISKSRK